MSLRQTFLLPLLLLGWCLSGGPAFGEKRVALVIGNSTYEKAARLPNPTNDAALIADTFKSAGFDHVELRRDLKVGDMRRALRDFMDRSREADVAVVYYAGHGIEVDGTNYLVPVDAVLERDVDVYDETLTLERVLVSVEPARQLRLVILDACRDNPFARSMKRTMASRAIGRGLAKVEPTSPNTLIAFASKAGSTASDGDGRNSPFAAALVKHITKPGLDLRRAFGYVRDDVLKSTGNRQEPYVYGSLGGDDVPLVRGKPPSTVPQADPNASVRKDYELALQLGTRDGWEAFLRSYPQGFYADLAKGQLKKVSAEEDRAAAAEKARQAEQEKARLAAEGARQAELAKAAAAAKAAEEIRIAAEKAKAVELEKAAAAERARQAEQEKARIAAEKKKQEEQEKAAAAERARQAEQEKARIAAEKKQEEQEKAAAAERARQAEQEKTADAEQVKLAAEKAAEEKRQQVAALSPSAEKSETVPPDLYRALQVELRRVGCNTSAVEDNWSTASQRALDLFNMHSGMKLDVKAVSVDALEAVKGKSGRICPLVCELGFKSEGDRCVKVTCGKGHQLNDSGTCDKIDAKKPTVKREGAKPKREQAEPSRVDAAPAKQQASGKIFCDRGGCRPVPKGCRIEGWSPRSPTMGSSVVCN